MSQLTPPPPLPPQATPSHSREGLRRIAELQKNLLVSILVYLLALIALLIDPAPLQLPVRIALLAAGVMAAVFVFLLAMKLYGQGTGIVLGILALIPVVTLIVLLIVNGKATGILKAHGIRVGLMGADVKAM